MKSQLPFVLRTLGAGDADLLREMLAVFADAFEDRDTYLGRPPDDAYLCSLLESDTFVALAAFSGASVVGGIAAYVLPKFEQQRAELYVYDLAVAEAHRRRGIATAMLEELGNLAVARGIHGIFVQADAADDAAIALYEKLGIKARVLHFDLRLRDRAS